MLKHSNRWTSTDTIPYADKGNISVSRFKPVVYNPKVWVKQIQRFDKIESYQTAASQNERKKKNFIFFYSQLSPGDSHSLSWNKPRLALLWPWPWWSSQPSMHGTRAIQSVHTCGDCSPLSKALLYTPPLVRLRNWNGGVHIIQKFVFENHTHPRAERGGERLPFP